MKHVLTGAALAIGLAACQPKESLVVAGAEYRPPLGATDIGVAYFTITSAKADRIVAVGSPEADSVEIHASVINNGRSSMQRLESVGLPAGKPVEFTPGGMHLMVFSPHPVPGDTAFPITIELQSGASRTISFEYRRGSEDHHG